jgi:hypothetical protein
MATAAQSQRAFEPGRWPIREALAQNLREAPRVATTARHKAEGAVAEVSLNVRRHPLRAVTGAAVLAGAVIGFAAGWFAGTRR